MTCARVAVAVLASALALTGAGCGTSAEDEAKSAVEDYLEAVSEGDGDKACSLLAARTRRRIEAAGRAAGRSCAQTFATLKQGTGKALVEAFADADVENVKITGPRATGDVKLRGTTQKVALRKEGGDWKLASAGFAS